MNLTYQSFGFLRFVGKNARPKWFAFCARKEWRISGCVSGQLSVITFAMLPEHQPSVKQEPKSTGDNTAPARLRAFWGGGSFVVKLRMDPRILTSVSSTSLAGTESCGQREQRAGSPGRGNRAGHQRKAVRRPFLGDKWMDETHQNRFP